MEVLKYLIFRIKLSSHINFIYSYLLNNKCEIIKYYINTNIKTKWQKIYKYMQKLSFYSKFEYK